MPSVMWSRRTESWRVFGNYRHHGPDGELVLKHGELAGISATELRRALLSNETFYNGATEAHVSLGDDEFFDEDGPIENVTFRIINDELVLEVVVFVPWPADGDDTAVPGSIAAIVRPLVSRSGAAVHSVEQNDWMTSPRAVAVKLCIVPSLRGRNLSQLYQLGADALQLADAYADGDPSRDTVANLIRGGAAHVLIGQPEGSWLEAKKLEYDLESDAGTIALAKAVAKFCNGEEGGVIVIGASTKRVPGGEVIRSVDGVQATDGIVARYLSVLDRRLYPPVQGLRIDVIPASNHRAVIMIDIPVQGEELKPFLVHGAILPDGKIEGAFISIVQRRGESSIPITAPMIHASLAAGRALLRGERGSFNG